MLKTGDRNSIAKSLYSHLDFDKDEELVHCEIFLSKNKIEKSDGDSETNS